MGRKALMPLKWCFQSLIIALALILIVGSANAQDEDLFSSDSLVSDSLLSYFQNEGPLSQNSTAINDTQPPAWSEQKQSTGEPIEGQTLLLYVLLEDDVALSHAILSTNETDADGWKNWTDRYTSPILMRGVNSSWAVFPWKNPSVKANTTVGWKVWFNDTAGNWNVTSVMTFKVQDSPDLYDTSDGSHNSTYVICAVWEAGCDYWGSDAIQEAIDAPITEVPEGSTLDVKGGTYNAIIVRKRSLSIIGRDPANVIIDGAGTSVAVTLIDQWGDLTKFSNFTIRNADFGIQIDAKTFLSLCCFNGP
jgi:hypothetical protein